MQGFKCFYDIKEKKFKCEDVPSEVGHYDSDGTTFWIDTYKHACNSVNIYNKEHLNEVFICKECGNSFFLTESEQDWFIEKHLNVPKRCYRCRKRKSNLIGRVFDS